VISGCSIELDIAPTLAAGELRGSVGYRAGGGGGRRAKETHGVGVYGRSPCREGGVEKNPWSLVMVQGPTEKDWVEQPCPTRREREQMRKKAGEESKQRNNADRQTSPNLTR